MNGKKFDQFEMFIQIDKYFDEKVVVKTFTFFQQQQQQNFNSFSQPSSTHTTMIYC